VLAVATTHRFDRPGEEPEEAARRVPDEVRSAREQVYFAYLRAREHGVGLLGDRNPENLGVDPRRFDREPGADDNRAA
jgi:hypothetical protein